jgi:hypothetical protein
MGAVLEGQASIWTRCSGVGELLDDIEIADANHATAKAVELWQAAWPDVLCTVPSGARRATEGRAS